MVASYTDMTMMEGRIENPQGLYKLHIPLLERCPKQMTSAYERASVLPCSYKLSSQEIRHASNIEVPLLLTTKCIDHKMH